MEGVLERMSSAQILAAIAILVGGLVLLTMIIAIARYQMRALETDTALRREQQNGELALRNKALEHGMANGNANLDALLTPSSPPSEDPNAALATRFGSLNMDPDKIEEALHRALTADPARKQAIITAMDELFKLGAEPCSILAAVRPLCPAAERSPVPTEL